MFPYSTASGLELFDMLDLALSGSFDVDCFEAAPNLAEILGLSGAFLTGETCLVV